MYYNFIPLIIILVGLAVITRIIVKKFPAVVNLDVSSLPQEKEKRVKQLIISNRLKRNLSRWFIHVRKLTRPLIGLVINYTKATYEKLLSTRENLVRETIAHSKGSQVDIDNLFAKAEEFVKGDDFAAAEKYYIEIISHDSKNIAAFRLLGQLYFNYDKFEEAKETFEHVLKLTCEESETYLLKAKTAEKDNKPDKAREYAERAALLNIQNGQTYFDLTQAYKEQNNHKTALQILREALQIEPKNPRYLDELFNLSILMKDKSSALDAYKALKNINPENGRLGEMKEKIDEL